MALFKKPLGSALALAVFGLAQPGWAQPDNNTQQTPPDYSKEWLLAFGVEHLSIDSEAAAREWIEDTAWSVYFEGEYFLSRQVSTALGFGFLGYEDNASFRQRVEDTWSGDEQTMESTASAVPVYGDIGYTQFSGDDNPLYWSARAGATFLVQSERSIDNCTDCFSDDIELDSGLYGMLAAGVKAGETWSLGLRYKNYLTGDFGRSFAFNVRLSL